MATQHLQVLGAGAGTDCQGESVVKLMDDEVEVNCLLPIHIRIPNGQFATVSPIYLHFSLFKSRDCSWLINLNNIQLSMQYSLKREKKKTLQICTYLVLSSQSSLFQHNTELGKYSIETTHLVFWNISRTLKMFFSNEEQKIICICRPVSLEEEVTYKEVCPVGGSLHHDKPCVCESDITLSLNF